MIEKQEQCPVCTLYLREGISLQSHLNTHPKDQVIEALIRCSGGSSANLSSPTKQQASESESSPSVDQQTNGNQFPVGNNVTTLTYQQFLNNGTTIFPHLVTVPTVMPLPSPYGNFPYGCSSNSVMQMVYSPYVVPQNNAQGNDELMRQLYLQNIQANTNPNPLFVPVSSSPVIRTTSTNMCNQVLGANSAAPVSVSNELNKRETCGRPISYDSELPEEEQGCNMSSAFQTDFPESGSPEVLQEEHCNSRSHSAELFSDRESPCETETGEEECLAENEDIKIIPDATELNEIPSEEIHSPTEETTLRVRTDLNSKHEEESHTTEDNFMNETSDLTKSVSDLSLQLPVPVSEENTPDPEYITSDLFINHEQTVEENNKTCDSNQGTPESLAKIIDLNSSGPLNIIEIDGIHILIPSQLLENPDLLEVFAPNLPVLHGSDSEHDSDSPPEATVKDIQTDERMPPRGELSEQESIGDNDNSVCSNTMIQTYPEEAAAAPPVHPAYDLLAIETWEGSDTSDVDRPGTPPSDSLVTDELSELVVETGKKCKTKQKELYMCASCTETFDCPKERRVHQNMHHGEPSSSSQDVPRSIESLVSSLIAPSSSETATLPAVIEDGECSNMGVSVAKTKPFLHSVNNRRTNHQNNKGNNIVKAKDVKFRARRKRVVKKDVSAKGERKSGEVSTTENDDVAADSGSNIKREVIFLPSVKEERSDVCSKTVANSSTALTDVLRVGEESPAVEQKFHCNECDNVFASERSLMLHKRVIHKCTERKCDVCDKRFENVESFNEHLKEHPLECLHCGKCFLRKQNLRLHVSRHLGIKNYKCSSCDRSFFTKQKLQEHMNTHTGAAPLKCSYCSQSFRRYSNLIQHKNRIHLKIKKKVKDFFCHCGEIFHSKKKLNWHKEIHDTKPKSCTFCCERFVHSASLTRHIRQMHDRRYIPQGGKSEENVECPVCSSVYLKSSLHIHMRVHSGERPFQCNICGKEFTTKWNLQLHRWIHASRSSKPFKCSLCKNAYVRKNDYVAHMRSHKNMRPYTCNFCGCQFVRKYNCLRHVREHETGKSYQCTVCNKTFHRSYYLKEHFRVHTGQRPFACHVCGKASSTKSNHNKHIRIHHAREPVNTEG